MVVAGQWEKHPVFLYLLHVVNFLEDAVWAQMAVLRQLLCLVVSIMIPLRAGDTPTTRDAGQWSKVA